MMADLRRDFVKAWGGRLSELTPSNLRDEAEDLRKKGEELLLNDDIPLERHAHEFTLDMRYYGQSFTLPIRWEPNAEGFDNLRQAFNSRHEEAFGFADTTNDAEIVNIRLVSIGKVDKPNLDFTPRNTDEIKSYRRKVWFDEWVETTVYERDTLIDGFEFSGPAIVEEAGGTSIVPPGWSVVVHPNGALVCQNEP